jgi:sugar phosphate isomerase/epimerase
MTLEDAMADIADLGATGVEILGEGNITGHPAPTSAWIGRWFRLLEKYALTPTSFGSWIDTRMWTERDLTVGEGQDQLAQDLRLASLLGFGYVRPKFGVVMLDLIPHPMWEEVVLRNLQLAADLDIVICPEIHSPTPLRHKVTESYVDLIERTCSNDRHRHLPDGAGGRGTSRLRRATSARPISNLCGCRRPTCST